MKNLKILMCFCVFFISPFLFASDLYVRDVLYDDHGRVIQETIRKKEPIMYYTNSIDKNKTEEIEKIKDDMGLESYPLLESIMIWMLEKKENKIELAFQNLIYILIVILSILLVVLSLCLLPVIIAFSPVIIGLVVAFQAISAFSVNIAIALTLLTSVSLVFSRILKNQEKISRIDSL